MATLTTQSANSTNITASATSTFTAYPRLLIDDVRSFLIDSTYFLLLGDTYAEDDFTLTTQSANSTSITNTTAS